MIRYSRRCCRMGNRSFLSTVFYMVLLVFIFCLFTTQFSLGRPNDPPSEHGPAKNVYPDFDQFQRKPKIGHLNERLEDPQINNLPEERHGMNINGMNINGRRTEFREPVIVKPSKNEYPLLAANGKFIPSCRIVHLDLKGGAYKPTFFPQIFDLLKRMKFTGVLLEWEDMFPFTGQLSKATNGYVYTIEDVRSILQAAKDRELEVIPLVQTLGHLEWVLKLEEFVHLRDDSLSPTVICVGINESFELIKDMIDQVARVHQEFGMLNFHMGADEAFQFGFCNSTLDIIKREGSRDKAVLWHLAKVATYIKNTYSVTILAWHDMFAHIMEDEIVSYKLPSLITPVLWSYAEDLDMYLPISTWWALKPFPNVWGASVYKGADGPHQHASHPLHYIRNHESWIKQFDRIYKDFKKVEGLIYSGWSRYDHQAILCELFPVAVPQLAMSAETMFEARPLESNYPRTKQWLGCEPNIEKRSFTPGCTFPGSRLYEIINDFSNRRLKAKNFLETDYDYNGWLSKVSDAYQTSSLTVIDKIIPNIDFHLSGLEYLLAEFKKEMEKIYYQETIDEYVFVYFADILETLRDKRKFAMDLKKQRTFPKRPFIVYPKYEL